MASSFKKLFDRAVSAGQNRDYPESLRLFRELLSTTDDFPQAYLYMGRCCHALDQKEIAVQYFRYFLNRFPQSAAGHFFMGRSLLSLGAHHAALHHFSRIYVRNPDYPQLKAFMGMSLLKMKKTARAVEFLGEAVEEDPENEKLYAGYLNALFLLGVRYFYREELDMSRQIFRFLEDRGVENILMDLHLAMLAREAGDYQESLQYYDRSCAASPEDPLIRIQRAEVLFLSGRRQDAVREWQAIPRMEGFSPESLDPESLRRVTAVEHFQNGDYRKAFFFATQSLKKQRTPEMHLLAGEAARNLGNHQVAENHFRRVLEKDPGLSEARFGLAMVHWLKGEWDQVLHHMTVIRRTQPEDPVSRYYITLSLCRLERPVEETLPRVRDEIRLSGPDSYLLSALAEQYVRASMPDLAEKWYGKALRIKEDHRDAWEGLLALQRAADDPKVLAETCRSYLGFFPEDREIRKELVLLLFRQKDYQGTINEMLPLLPYVTRDQAVQRILACSYRETGKFREATLIYRNLLREEPENQVLLRSLIFCLEKNGQRKTAIMLLKKALGFLPPSATMQLILGVLCHREKQLDDALAAYRKARDLDPGDWRPHFNMGTVYRDRGMDDYASTHFSRAEKLKSSAGV